MKRLWITRFDCGTSRKYFKKEYYRINFGDKCAICRSKLEENCINCIIKINKDIIKEFKDRARYIFMFLLIEQKRKDSPFNVFDLNIISNIYKYCVEGTYESNECTIVLLQCNHVFHKHCFEEWIHKRLLCPLCNGKIIMPRTIDNYKYTPIEGSLVKIQDSQYDDETYYQMQEDALNIQAVLCKLLKHYKPGYDRDTLCQLALQNFPRWVDDESFDKAIKYLVSRDYILYDNNSEKYVYIP